jgi:hypothetical protein
VCAWDGNQWSRGVVTARVRTNAVRSLHHQRRDLHQSTYPVPLRRSGLILLSVMPIRTRNGITFISHMVLPIRPRNGITFSGHVDILIFHRHSHYLNEYMYHVIKANRIQIRKMVVKLTMRVITDVTWCQTCIRLWWRWHVDATRSHACFRLENTFLRPYNSAYLLLINSLTRLKLDPSSRQI